MAEDVSPFFVIWIIDIVSNKVTDTLKSSPHAALLTIYIIKQLYCCALPIIGI